MSKKVFILQSDRKAADQLAQYFSSRGDKVFVTVNSNKAYHLIKKYSFDIALIDLHAKGKGWLDALQWILHKRPDVQLIVTSRHPDVRREMMAKESGAQVFLREPFTSEWIERALQNLVRQSDHRSQTRSRPSLPKVRVPIRFKITFPFALLALVFAIAAAHLTSRFVLESINDRFTNQLLDAGKLTADWMVQMEDHLLNTLRLLAHTEGVAEAIAAQDSDRLREIALPVAVNYGEEAIEVLDAAGASVLSMRRQPGGREEQYESIAGERLFAKQDFVQQVLAQQIDAQGDKFTGLVNQDGASYFFIAGPVFDDKGNLAGAILVGKPVESIARQIREATLSHITFYTHEGTPLTTTLLNMEEIHALTPDLLTETLALQDEQSVLRDIVSGSTDYVEVLAPWEVRGGEDMGVMGIALAPNLLVSSSLSIRMQALAVIVLGLISVVTVGLLLSNQLTTPLTQVVQASTQVAHGNLEVKVPLVGNDEVAVLAQAFNYMVSGLQEGFIYRELLGRTVSPEVRHALRESFASGTLRLEGQNKVATVLISDIRNFTSLAEREEPTVILKWLNEYFGELVPVITAHGGVVDKFEGDAMLAFFGILPAPLSPEESASQACHAGLEMLKIIERINHRRVERGEPALITGIGIHTGTVTVGGLGTSDRLNYTIIGDTVNTTERMQSITREFGSSGMVISENTLDALKDKRQQLRLKPLGEHELRGKRELMWLYRVLPEKTPEPESLQEQVVEV